MAEGAKARCKVVKKIIHAGRGQPVEFCKDAKAIFDYEVLLPRDSEQRKSIDVFSPEREAFNTIDSTKNAWPAGYGKPLELVFGKGFQLPIFESCLSTMLIDEISQFDIDKHQLLGYPTMAGKLRDIGRADSGASHHSESSTHQHRCAASGPIRTGYPALDELIEEPSCLRIIFNLIEVLRPEQYSLDNWQLGPEKKLLRLESMRQEGNTLFVQEKYLEASEKYREALSILDTLLLAEKPGESEWKELDQKNIPLYSNLSQCFLQLQRFRDADATACEVLNRDPQNEKALLRRAKARIGLWELDQAASDLSSLLKINPKLAGTVAQQVQLIAEKRKEKNDCDRLTYKAMFKGESK